MRRRLDGRVLIGSILVILGIVFLLDKTGAFGSIIFDFIFSFEFFVFIVGLMILVNTNNKPIGIGITLIGAGLLVQDIFNIDTDLTFPFIAIAIGAALLFSRNNPSSKFGKGFPFTKSEVKKDMLDELAIFGGGEKIVSSDNFKGGNITAIFGGFEIDLSRSVLAHGENIIDVVALFGGCEITVPKEWDVRIQGTPIFGGFTNKAHQFYKVPENQESHLIIKGVAVFGGVEIKIR